MIDLRSLAPLDMDTVLTSVARTKRAVVVHEAVRTCGAGAEIAARIHEELHDQLPGPVRRLTAPDSSVPAPLGSSPSSTRMPTASWPPCRPMD